MLRSAVDVMKLGLVALKEFLKVLKDILPILKDSQSLSNTNIRKVHPHLLAVHMLIFDIDDLTIVFMSEHTVSFQGFKETEEVPLLWKHGVLIIKTE